jgi:hypothetical protein
VVFEDIAVGGEPQAIERSDDCEIALFPTLFEKSRNGIK